MNRALQVRDILYTRGLTLYSVSRQSAEIFGRASQFYVPHNLYYDLARSSLQPTLYQICALSRVTNYRLSDWVAVFGFDLDAISRLQLLIPRLQTSVLDSTVHDLHAWIPWFAPTGETTDPALSIAPLGHFLARATPKRAKDLLRPNSRKFLYARVGVEDLYARPYFAPQSIVRADPRCVAELLACPDKRTENPFFLVEHEFGWTCSRLILLEKNRVLLHCPQMPCAERELQIGRRARILGAIDAEIRPALPHCPIQVRAKSVAPRKRRGDHLSYEQTGLKDLLRRSRTRVGLSFREASSISRLIADTLSDELYFAAASTLSDYEALSLAPRHMEKIITLCVLYCIGFDEFSRASGLSLDEPGREPIPDELVPRQAANRICGFRAVGPDNVHKAEGGFLDALVNRWEDVPLFLRFSFEEITGLRGVSLSDVFWMGSEKAPRHPMLIRATLVVVNRRARKPSASVRDAVCGPPLYLILRRDGTYLCGSCTLDEGDLIVHSYPGSPMGAVQFRNNVDAEVVGQITTILRRLL